MKGRKTDMDFLIEMNDITKNYREFTLDKLSISLNKGYIYGLIGPNGAGKTTTIKILMNIINPDGGDFSILGMKYPKDEKAIKNKIGYVGEEQYFYEDRTVNWTGKFVSKFFKEWDENYFGNLLMRFKISRSKKIRELSKGMRVKLSLAIALSHNPDIILLDEPTSGLDPVIRREILDLLRDLIIENPEKSVLLSSHITDDLERIADYISYMIDGKIVLASEKDRLLSDWKKIHLKNEAMDEEIKKGLTGIEVNAFGSSGITDRYEDMRETLAAGIKSGDIKVENLNLDDILITLMEKRGEV
jgi:ABC-2 type transport system ATP-binding protein